MGRPKGSKNKVKKGPLTATGEEIEEQIHRVQDQIESLNAELVSLSCDVKSKRQQIRSCKKELCLLEQTKEQADAALESNRRQEQAKQVADAFLASGRSVEEALNLLGSQENRSEAG
ncbi:MAG: hypothetical protein ACI3YK_06640 [Eubacteriales bacterium]